MPAFTLREDDPESFHTFVTTLDRNDDKTIAAYLTTLRDLAAWLATQPDGTPFHPALLTVTALEGYFAHLEAEQRAPRTRAKALTAITRFCRWAIDAGQLQRNSAHQIKRPTVPALSPTELAPHALALCSRTSSSARDRCVWQQSLPWATGLGCVSVRWRLSALIIAS